MLKLKEYSMVREEEVFDDYFHEDDNYLIQLESKTTYGCKLDKAIREYLFKGKENF